MKLLSVFALLASIPVFAQEIPTLVNSELPQLVSTYKDLHEHPELSRQEKQTSAVLAEALRKAGYTVTENVGKYDDGTAAFGVVAVMKNGAGPTVLVRTDMDALPVEEKTGVPYASHARSKNQAGDDVGVMHACGHDIHVTTMIGVGETLAQLKNQWHGTLILVGQPSEETVEGARAMLNDNLYARFGRPDYAIALHDDGSLEAGKVGVVSGPTLAAVNSVDVIVRGVGSHGAHPEASKDPVVMSAEYIMAIQTIVSRQIPPQSPAVITVGAIHGGTKRNIIPDEVTMNLTIRSFDDGVQKQILADLKRTAEGIAIAGGVPSDRMPIVTLMPENSPVTYNNPELADRLRAVLVRTVGANNVVKSGPEMVSEDFGLFGLEGQQIPTVMLRLGAVAPEKVAENKATGKPLPSLHSAYFVPLPEPTIRTGVMIMTASVLDLMGR
ncbi:MAG TPA: amidohydrolase [Candidatus Eisenbacteria bacterium]|nr:amidohydrolase [Candidatus Eisenbacteria bacterium]